MKRKLILMMGLLLWLGIFSACSKSEDVASSVDPIEKSTPSSVDSKDQSKESSVKPDSVSDTSTPIDERDGYVVLSEFFQSNYYHHPDTEYLNFFKDSDESQCLLINSTEELLKYYTGVDTFPNIDFSKYTLIVGQEMMPESYYTILRQELLTEGDDLILNVYVPKMEGGYFMVQHLFYWGLYPKLNSTTITVNIIKE